MEQIRQKVNVRVMIDKLKNKVVYVEAGGDFVDILLSFLTLPMATIVRLVNPCQDGPQGKVGSLSTLYESVLNIEPKHLSRDEQRRDLLITLRNQLEAMCKKLKINVDNTEQLRYFLCRDCCREYDGVFVTESASFLVTDDLCIMENSVRASVDILSNLDYISAETIYHFQDSND
ncbi:hypothetical protein POM88_024224 [Heracleum sosnowskyi]|uniref:Uncharacterized protein n=1 Tax=Heracleum sosnowskyi TaxID=360622 RepID=A0AAD8I2I8_9APIA|nr:hypothetical protein POM88_024224 [Heracleum sosnowskyi]